MRFYFLILCLIYGMFNTDELFSQEYQTESRDCNYFMPYSHSRNIYNVLTNDNNNVYKNTSTYRTSILKLNDDSTFLYYDISKVAFDVSTGKYTLEYDLLTLNWDSVKTHALAEKEPEEYKEQFMFKKPSPLKIEKVVFVKQKDRFTPYRYYTDVDGLELLYKSDDLFKKNTGLYRSSTFGYNGSGKKLLVTSKDKSQWEIPCETIWGFAIHQNHNIKVYRTAPRGMNPFGIPGVRVVQMDELIIYNIGDNQSRSYFSKDLNSEIYPLTMKEVKKVFADDKEFLFKLYREFGLHGPITASDAYFNGYKFIELYRLYKKD